jgi:pimeloyl-ACP methyl ester carboxylesterase
MTAKIEVKTEPEGFPTKVHNLMSRRRMFALLGGAAASVPFITSLETDVKAAGEVGEVTITKQGSFFVGGTTITTPGTFNPAQANGPGAIYYIDHLYAQYQTPSNARQYPIVMVHGSNQTSKTWETTPDGRDGFQTIFLKRGFSVYMTDNPRRARAGFPSFNGPMGELAGKQIVPPTTTRPSAQQGFTAWRLGPRWGEFYPNSAFPQANGGLEQFCRQHICNVGDYNQPEEFREVLVSSLVALFDKIGPGIIMPHSQSSPFSMMAAIRQPKIVALYDYEPAAYVWPQGEPLPDVPAADAVAFHELPLEEFKKLAKIPVCIVYGDNLPPNHSRRKIGLAMVALLKKYGGDATLLQLPEVGLHGNGHFMFFDLNNVQIADIASKWFADRGLDKRA